MRINKKKESKIILRKGILAIIERLTNDKDGNPRYQVQFINTKEIKKYNKPGNEHYTISNNQYYTIKSYNIDFDVCNFIDNNIILNFMEV